MGREKPKYILRIKDATFSLPPDFNGDIKDAFAAFLKYHRENYDGGVVEDLYKDMNLSTFDELILSANPEHKACINCELFKLNDDGVYESIEMTGDTLK